MSRPDTTALEFNVGAMTLLALGFFVWLALFVGDSNPFGGEYQVYADYEEIQLLQQGDPIRKNGLIIGKVEGFRFVGNRVRVSLRIQAKFRIRKDATVAVGNVGLFGANYIKVTEPALEDDKENPGYYKAGDIIAGETAPEFETLLSEGTRLLGDLRDTVRSLTAILDDDAFREDLKRTATEIRKASEAGRRTLQRLETSVGRLSRDAESTLASARQAIEGDRGVTGALERLNELMSTVDAIANENRRHLARTTSAIKDIVEDIRDRALAARLTGAAEQMEKFAGELAGFVGDLNKNGHTADQIRRITDRVADITDDVAAVTSKTRGALEDSDLKGDLSQAFDDVHTIASRVDEIGGKLGEVRAEVVASLFYSDNADDFRPDLNATLRFGTKGFLRFGIEDIGGGRQPGGRDGDEFNFQVGKSLSSKDQLRLGIVADEFGIGYDRYLFGRAVQVRLEAFRPDDLLFRYATRFRLREDLFLSWRHEDFGSPRGHVSYFGVERRF